MVGTLNPHIPRRFSTHTTLFTHRHWSTPPTIHFAHHHRTPLTTPHHTHLTSPHHSHTHHSHTSPHHTTPPGGRPRIHEAGFRSCRAFGFPAKRAHHHGGRAGQAGVKGTQSTLCVCACACVCVRACVDQQSAHTARAHKRTRTNTRIRIELFFLALVRFALD